MKVSAAGRAALTAREGRRLVAYRDSVGVLTVGVGHTGRMSPPIVTEGMRITPEQCDAFLEADLAPVEASINALRVPLTQNQFDALASFAFNIGVPRFEGSNVVSCLRHGLTNNAADALMNWVKPAVLRSRREGERKQFLTPDAAPVASRPTPSATSSIVDKALNPAPGRGPSPAPTSATSATKESTMNPASILGSLIAPNMSVLSTVIQIGTHIPDIIEGVQNVVPPAQKAYAAFEELFRDIQGKGQKPGGVVEDIQEIVGRVGEIWAATGLDPHKAADVAAKAPQLPAVNAIGELKKILHI